MFFYLEGNVVQKHDTFFVLDIQGVGFKIYTSHSTLNCLSPGGKTMIYTYTYVREDALDVFGFLTRDELSFFEKLISISGVGPRLALAILSTFSAGEIVVAILTNDSKKLSKAPGVGPKLAQRMILELKDKVKDEDIQSVSVIQNTSLPLNSEAVDALMALGYGEAEATKAVSAVGDGLSLEETIKTALTYLIK